MSFSISDATSIFVVQAELQNGSPQNWLIVVESLGEQRIYASCPYPQYATDVVYGLRLLAGLELLA